MEEKIYVGSGKKAKDFARNVAICLSDLPKEYIFEYKNNAGAESSGSKSTDIVDFDNLTDEEALKLPKEEYWKYTNYMAKKQQKWKNAK